MDKMLWVGLIFGWFAGMVVGYCLGLLKATREEKIERISRNS